MPEFPPSVGVEDSAVATASVLDARLRRVVRLAGTGVLGIGGLILLGGWLLDIPALRSFPLGSLEVKANTALGLLAAGAALLLLQPGASPRRRRFGQACTALAALIGLLSAGEWTVGRNFGIDQLLFVDQEAASSGNLPGRPALNTALALVVLGLAFWALDRRTRRAQSLKDALSLVVGLAALTGLLGHLVDEHILHSLMPFGVMAVPTAVALLLLAAGSLAARLEPVPSPGLPSPGPDPATPRSSLVAGFVAALVLIATVTWLDWRESNRLQETLAWVARTYDVQARLNRTLALVEEIEAGARGFVVTGDEALLGSFESALTALATQKRELAGLILDAEQRADFESNEPLIAERIELARRSVELRRSAGFEAARQQVATAGGSALMERIRAEFARMDAKQRTLLAQRSAAARREAKRVGLLTVIGVVLSGGLLAAVFALVLRENRLRRRSEIELDRFFTLALDLLGIAGTDGHFKRLNPAFSRTLGHSREALLARPFLEFVHPDDHAATLAEMAKLDRGESTLSFENRYRCEDGSWKWLSWRVQPFLDEHLLYASARDITDGKRSEESLRAAGRRLEAANAELEAFSYSVSHDLRAPLRSIDGFSQVLLEDFAAHLDPEGRGYLDRVRAAAQRMGELIDDLLQLSRISRSELVRQEVNLSEMVADITGRLRGMEPERKAEVEIEPGLVTRADPHLARIALENLLGNAWKFTRERSATRIRFGAAPANGAWSYFVGDNGAGFDMKYASKLFTPFQRLHSSQQFEGTGIGLAIVARIVHRHDGELRAEAAVDQGATIYFTLGPKDVEPKGQEAET